MRASCLTAVISGIGFGAMILYLQPAESLVHGLVILLALAVFVFFGTIGFPQWRELMAEQKLRPKPHVATKADFRKFFLPSWGRMLLMFGAAVGTGLLLRLAAR